MYRLYHEVEVSMWFTHQGSEARGVETDTEWYNRLVPWATWLWQRIYDIATIAFAIKGSSMYLATIQTIVDHHRSSPTLDIDDNEPTCRFLPTLASSLTFRTTILSSLYTKGRPLCDLCWFQLKKDNYSCSSLNYWLGNQSLHPYN